MKSENSENFTNRRRWLPWVLYGATLAPLLVILFSYLHLDRNMREVPVLLAVSIAGALAGRLSFTIIQPGRPLNWKSPLLLLLSLLIYGLAIGIGFVMARLGPF